MERNASPLICVPKLDLSKVKPYEKTSQQKSTALNLIVPVKE
jgi:hypothetical protein